MRVLGDKVGSTLLAQTAGVPTIPWNAEGMTADLLPDGTIPFDQFDAACIHTEQVRPAPLSPPPPPPRRRLHRRLRCRRVRLPPLTPPPPLAPPQEAVDAAERVGYPVMLKASEGGGGKGIRKAETEEELRAAYPQARRRAAPRPPRVPPPPAPPPVARRRAASPLPLSPSTPPPS